MKNTMLKTIACAAVIVAATGTAGAADYRKNPYTLAYAGCRTIGKKASSAVK